MINKTDVKLEYISIDNKKFVIRFEPNELFIYCVNLNEFYSINYDTYKLLLLIEKYGYYDVLNKISKNKDNFSNILSKLGICAS